MKGVDIMPIKQLLKTAVSVAEVYCITVALVYSVKGIGILVKDIIDAL